MKKTICVLLVLLMVTGFTTAFAQASDASAEELLKQMAELQKQLEALEQQEKPVQEGERIPLTAELVKLDEVESRHNARWLDDRDLALVNTYGRGYRLVTPEGEELFAVDYEYVSYVKNGFFSVVNENGLNKSGLVNAAGKLVIPMEYSDFEILSDRYGIAVVLEETKDDAYDYGSGLFGSGDEHYNVTSYDFYDLEKELKIGSLGRSDFRKYAKAFDDGFLVEDRNGKAKWYDLSLAYVKDTEEDVYGASRFKTVDRGIAKTGVQEGEVILEGYKYYDDLKEDSFVIRSTVNSLYGAIDMDGNIIVPAEYTEVQRREGDYVIVAIGDYDNRKYGVYKIGTGLVVPCEFDKFERMGSNFIANGYLLFNSEDKLGYVNVNGIITAPAQYRKSIATILGSCFFVTDLDGSYIVVAADGTQTKADYVEIYMYDNETRGRLLNAKNSSEKWELVDCYAKPVIDIASDYKFTSFSPSGTYLLIENVFYKVD